MAPGDPILWLGAWHSRHPDVSMEQAGQELISAWEITLKDGVWELYPWIPMVSSAR